MVEVTVKTIEPRMKEVVPVKPKLKEVKTEAKTDTGNTVKESELEERAETSDAPASSWTSSSVPVAPVLAQTPRETQRARETQEPERKSGTREFSAYETMRREDAARPYNPLEHSPTLAPNVLPVRGISGHSDPLFANPDLQHKPVDRERDYIPGTKLEDARPKRKMDWE